MFNPPKSTKFRKYRKGRSRGTVNQSLVYGNVGFKVAPGFWVDLTARQIESARRVLSRQMKKANGKIYIRVFPDYPRTAKPAEVRQGKGKGSVDRYVFRAKPGAMIFEIACPEENKEVAIAVLKQAAYKMPFSVEIVVKETELGVQS
ncbi:MAG: 50S ribosomal protein L16 [Candidatus Comchoanobacterales bacterium]